MLICCRSNQTINTRSLFLSKYKLQNPFQNVETIKKTSMKYKRLKKFYLQYKRMLPKTDFFFSFLDESTYMDIWYAYSTAKVIHGLWILSDIKEHLSYWKLIIYEWRPLLGLARQQLSLSSSTVLILINEVVIETLLPKHGLFICELIDQNTEQHTHTSV